MKRPKLTIIVPTLDEGAVLDSFFRRLMKIRSMKSSQIIVVDGGSVDNTRDTVFSWAKKHRQIEWLEAPRGKGAGLRIAFPKARAKHIVFIDADLQYPPEEIPRIASALRTHDLVVTRRATAPADHRRALSLVFANVFGKGLLSLPVSDPQSGLKGIRSCLLEKIKLSARNWELDAELIHKAHFSGAKIKEIKIDFAPRHAGRTKTGIIGTSANLFTGSMKLAFGGNGKK